MRCVLFISGLLLSICLASQNKYDLDSLYFKFGRQLNRGDSGAWKSLKALQELAATGKAAAVYYDLARAGSFIAEQEREQAFASCMDALDRSNELKCDSLLFRSYYKIGFLYLQFDDLTKALNYFNRSLLLQASVKNLNDRIFLYRDIALVYSYLSRNKESIDYFLRMEPMVLQTGNKTFLGNIYNNLGVNYMSMNDSVKALFYFRKSLQVRYEINDGHGIAQIHNNLGTLYMNNGQNKKALEYFLKGLELRQKANVPINGIIESNINIGKVYYKMGQVERGRQYLESARDEAVRIGQIELERRADEELLTIYSAKGDYKKAFDLQSRYFWIKDSLYGLDKKEEISRMSFENKLREDSLKHEEVRQKEMAVHNEKEKRAALVRNISIGGFLLVLVVAFVLFAQVKRIRSANLTIAAQKDQIEQKQKEVLDSIHYARRIQQSLLPSEIFIKRVLGKFQNKN